MASNEYHLPMVEFPFKMSLECTRRFTGTLARRMAELQDVIGRMTESGNNRPCTESDDLDELKMLYSAIAKGMRDCRNTSSWQNQKQPPVDRGKLLIGMEVCRRGIACDECPYHNYGPCKTEILNDALSYVCYLEEQLEEARDGT